MQGALAAEKAKVRMHMGESTQLAVWHHREQEQNVGARWQGPWKYEVPSASFTAVL